MTLEDFKDLLGRWGWYCSRKGASSLGYAMSSYAERTGGDGWSRDHFEADADVLRFDAWIQRIEDEVREPLVLHYVVKGPAKTKHRGMGSAAYYARLDLARRSCFARWVKEPESEMQT